MSSLFEACGGVGRRCLGAVWCLSRYLRVSEARTASTRCMLGAEAASPCQNIHILNKKTTLLHYSILFYFLSPHFLLVKDVF